MRLLTCVGLLLGFGSTLLSGVPFQESPRGPIISVETDLVILPVTVTDSHGRSVQGLTADRFTVYDNGEPRTIEFFTSEDIPATVGLVIDSSSSMRGRREDVAAAGTAFAEFSHPRDELFTVNFNENVWLGLPTRVAFAESIDQLRAALTRAPTQGMTALYDAVDLGIDHLTRGICDRKALIIVSDGGDNASARTLNGVLEHAQRAGAVIYAVMLVDPDNRDAKPDVLRRLARETGGEAFAPGRTLDVTRALTRMARAIRTGYTIGLSPADAPGGGFRTIRVLVDHGDRQFVVRTRAGYYGGRVK
jgi:Ca-activated chloride channel family protein